MQKNNENFEFYINELEKIIRKLESKDITLDQSISLFEEGANLAKICESILNDANLKIKEIQSDFSEQNTE